MKFVFLGIIFCFNTTLFATTLPTDGPLMGFNGSDWTPVPNMRQVSSERSCAKVDISEKMGPVRNQTGGTCYAYSAIDILDFNNNEKHSPLHLAVISTDEHNKKIKDNLDKIPGFAGGHIAASLAAAQKVGICPEDILKSGLDNQNYRPLYLKLISVFEGAKPMSEECLEDVFSQAGPIEGMGQLVKNIQIQGARKNKTKALKIIKKNFQQFPIEKFEAVFNSSNSAGDFIKNVLKEICQTHLKSVDKKKVIRSYSSITKDEGRESYHTTFDSQKKLVEAISKGLDKGLPVGLSYYTFGLINLFNGGEHSAHASVITGRVWKDRQFDLFGNVTAEAGCYYMVKNSWGKDWAPPFGVKAMGVEGKPGYFMLSEKQLMEHGYGATFLE